MKIEVDIADINRDEVIQAMAAKLLGDTYEHYDGDPEDPDPTPRPTSSWDRKQIGKHLRVYFEARIKDTIDKMVASAIDQGIRDTISTAVREAVEEGWQQFDDYGRPKGERKTLKSIVLDALTLKDHSSYNSRTVAERVAVETIERACKAGFEQEMAAAQRKFREQADALVQAKFTETIKAALGLR